MKQRSAVTLVMALVLGLGTAWAAGKVTPGVSFSGTAVVKQEKASRLVIWPRRWRHEK